MPRKPRLHFPGALFHVTLRGNHRQPIFFAAEDRAILNRIVSQTIEKCGTRIHAYCWMGNHIHMLTQVGEIPLGRVILRVASRYARTVQARLETTGHLFERRYHAVLVDADNYLLTLLRYVHRNPVRAGLVRRVGDYPWSSHHAYVGARVEPWVTTDLALSMLGHNATAATAAYRRLVAGPADEACESPLAEVNASDPRVLGDDGFVAGLATAVYRQARTATLDTLIDETCRLYRVGPAELLSASRRRNLTPARAWLARQALNRGVASVSAVARRLGRDESTLRQLLARYHPSGPAGAPDIG